MSARLTLVERFDRTWFAPAPLLDLAICRLIVVGFQLFVMLVPYALLLYPVYGMLDHYAALPAGRYQPIPLFKLLMAPFGFGARPSFELSVAVFRISVACGFVALIGWRTRFFLALFALGNTWLSAYSYCFGEHHHTDAITTVMLWALALSPSGGALSLDAGRARRAGGAPPRSSEFARWPLLLIRWMFALCYLSSALCKLLGGGPEWLNGYTLRTYVLQDGARWGTASSLWVAGSQPLGLALSWMTVLVEGLFFLVLRWPRLALFFVPAAALLHLGIHVTMRAPFALYLPLFAVFVPWSRWLRPDQTASAARASATGE